ncbi:MAG: nuclear transport factor 2 family protein [Gammaproteobacteria bacterium]
MRPASVQDDLDVRRLLATYCHLCDDGLFDAVVALFTPDGSLAYGAYLAEGAAAIRAFFQDFQGDPEKRGKHLTMNTVVEVEGERGRAQSDVLFVRFFGGVLAPYVAARYRDDLLRVDGQWRFARREIVRLHPAVG